VRDTYTAVTKNAGEWWIGWIEEVPGVNCQERSYDELMESLRVTLREALELNRQDALSAAGSGYREEPIAV
jgi:predicted RNase H-like HicB family nuclease